MINALENKTLMPNFRRGNSDHDRQGLQDDLCKISTWYDEWEMPFNVKKCHVLQVGTRNLKNHYEMSGVKLGSVPRVTYLGVTIASNLKFFQQCKDAASEADRMLDIMNKKFSFKIIELILLLYNSLVRPHLEYAVQFWLPHLTKDIAKLKAVQRRGTKMILSLRNKSYKERLARLNLFSLIVFQNTERVYEC